MWTLSSLCIWYSHYFSLFLCFVIMSIILLNTFFVLGRYITCFTESPHTTPQGKYLCPCLKMSKWIQTCWVVYSRPYSKLATELKGLSQVHLPAKFARFITCIVPFSKCFQGRHTYVSKDIFSSSWQHDLHSVLHKAVTYQKVRGKLKEATGKVKLHKG